MQQIPDWADALVRSPLDDKLELEVLALAPERTVGRIPVDGNQQPLGLLHGGASGVLVETLASLAAAAHARTLGKVPVGVDLHVTHVKAVRSGHVTGIATPVRLGHTMAALRVEIRDDAGTITAFGTLTCQLVDAPPR